MREVLLPSPTRRVSDRAVLSGHASDPAEAEQIVARAYLPNRVTAMAGGELNMDLTGMRLGAVTVGQLQYGREVRLITTEASHFHVNVPLRGKVKSRTGRNSAVMSRGDAAVFSPGERADIEWSADSVQLCLMMPASALENELEQLLGRELERPLEFAFEMDLKAEVGRRWQPALHMLVEELASASAFAGYPAARRHVEALVLDGLLLSHRHNFSDELGRAAAPGPRGPIGQAADLMAAHPEEPWSSARLAAEVHMSVRSLQEGFKRHLDMPPSAYLRHVRLKRVREALQTATPGLHSVAGVARSFGFLHMGRFAAAYREAFGERPVDTLRRTPT